MKKIKIREHKEIDKQRWDNLVDKAPDAYPWWRSWYLDMVSPGWDAVVYGNYEYVLPLPHRKKALIRYVYPPDFTQQLGVFGTDLPDSETVTAMIEKATAAFRYLELNLNHKNPIGVVEGEMRKRRNYELQLGKPYNKLARHYHHNTRRNLKKCAKEGLEVKDSRSPAEVITLFMENKARRLSSLKGTDLELLNHLANMGLQLGIAEVKHVYFEENLLGGAIFFNEKNRKVFLFSGLSAEGRKKRAMFFLIDRVIAENTGNDNVLDFEGSDDKNLGEFYHRFGAEEKLYLHLKINRLPQPLRWLKK